MKNKLITSIMAAALICASLTACQTTPAPERTGDKASTIPTQPDKEHYHFVEREDSAPHKVYRETDGDETLYISNTCEKVSFVAYERVDSQAAKKMNDFLDNVYNNHRTSSDTMIKDLDGYLLSESVDLSVFPWETKVDYSCTRNDGMAISIIETIDFYAANKLEGTTVRTFNFDPLTGDLINNIFYTAGDTESLDAADEMIYNKLISQYGEESGITYSMPALTSMVDEAIPGWYFTETGIKIIFNPGSIAPIENGTFELEIAKEDLPEDAQKYFN